ncbi:hypothetical protein CGE01nite_12520 [Cellulomonas gelida]|uniref:Uncharacterized protein n=1 Tax=Cellulomonas gelida TaxID=1712 RepID=A0A4Y3KHW0_9CELL|nr:hypothetical protein CGE01nite_12520 [Cellulomonas gelida]
MRAEPPDVVVVGAWSGAGRVVDITDQGTADDRARRNRMDAPAARSRRSPVRLTGLLPRRMLPDRDARRMQDRTIPPTFDGWRTS